MLDRAELEEPILRYQWGFDTADFDLVAAAVTDDIVIVAVPDPEIGDEGFDGGELRIVGRDALLASLRRSRAAWAERGEQPRNTFLNFAVDAADEAHARVRTYYAVYVHRDDLERPLATFYWGYDTNDMDMVADAYTEDVELLATPDPFLGDVFEGEVRVMGREALVARHAPTRAAFAERGEVPRHTYTNFFVDRVDGTEAEARAYYLMYVQSAEDGTVFIGLSPVHLRLALEPDGRWRIRHQHVVCAHLRGYSRLRTADQYVFRAETVGRPRG